ncbi:MAG: hypothetical protein IPK72_05605 [Candidatus Eisenbacteria bacterium]|nr:hypothetical protein [Candidatus Eisenbacteria bacterium]
MHDRSWTAPTTRGVVSALLIAGAAFPAGAFEYDFSWSLPKPQGSGLNAVVFEADALTGYAVGDGGAVVRTTDGGLSWQVRGEPGALLADLQDVILLAPGTLLAVGALPSIFRPDDAGLSWTPVANPAVGTLHDVAVVAGSTLCALGEDGQVLRSLDAGLTWSQRPSPKNTTLKDQLWLDADLGYALGFQCARRTTNGGTSWSTLPGVSETGFEDWTEAWALGDEQVNLHSDFHFVRTTNGGASWTVTPVANELVYHSTTVVLGPAHRLVSSLLEGAGIFETTNDGLDWTPRLLDQEARGVGDLIRLDSGVLIAVTSDGDLQRSSDGGVTWSNATRSPDDETRVTISNFARAPIGHLFAGSTQPGDPVRRFHRSTDDGESFLETAEPGINFMNALVALDSGVLLAGGGGSTGQNRVWRSTDEATSWTSHLLPNSISNGVQCYDLEAVSASTAYAVGFGTSASLVFWSTDAGVTWEQRSTGIPGATALFAIDFLDPLTGFVGGGSTNHPVIYRTTNGGASWHPAGTSGIPTSVAELHWLDAQTGLAATGQFDPGAFRTTNGGSSWNLVLDRRVLRFSFADQARGYATIGFQSGQLSRVFETVDTGLSWNEVLIPNRQGTETVQALPDGFIAGGFRSTIMRARISNPATVDGTRPRGRLSLTVRNSVGSAPRIAFRSVRAGTARVSILDPSGRLVRSLLRGPVAPGQSFDLPWDGRDANGEVAPSGVYFVRVANGPASAVGRLTLLRR